MQNPKTNSQPSFLNETAGILFVALFGSFLATIFEYIANKQFNWTESIDKLFTFIAFLLIADFILIRIRGKGTFDKNPFLK
jgi:hypothetical protein